jgi:addiction module RelE/StbE family toxin
MSDKIYDLKFTPKASEDLDQIYGYISGKLSADIAAKSLLEKIESNVMRLQEFPFSCNYVKDDFLKNKGYRKLVVDSYIVFYIVDERKAQVIIMRVLYGAQNYLDIL